MVATMKCTILYGTNLKSKETYWDTNYHKNSDFQYEAGKKAVDSLELAGNESVLDIGCGTGRTSAYLSRRLTSGSLTAIDSSSTMIDFAQQEYKDIQNINFKQLDILEMKFKEEFDFVFSTFCLHWVKDYKKALYNIHQSLKPGGKALLYISTQSALSKNWSLAELKILQEYQQFADLSNDKEFFLLFKNDWLLACQEINFKIIQESILKRSINFSMQSLRQYVKALNIASELNEADRDLFINKIISELYKIYNKEENEPFLYTTETIILNLEKQ